MADGKRLLAFLGQGQGIAAAGLGFGKKTVLGQFVQAALAVAPVQMQGLVQLRRRTPRMLADVNDKKQQPEVQPYGLQLFARKRRKAAVEMVE